MRANDSLEYEPGRGARGTPDAATPWREASSGVAELGGESAAAAGQARQVIAKAPRRLPRLLPKPRFPCAL